MDIEAKNPPSVSTVLTESEDKAKKRVNVVEEVKKLLWLAGPLIGVSLLQYSLTIISLMYVGRLGKIDFSGAAMANSLTVCICYSLQIGMSCALDTLCGQSYGAGHYHMLGIHMQRAMLVLSVVSIPLIVILANTRLILVSIGQDPAISARAQTYALFMIPSILAYALLQCLLKFLQTQNNVFPMMISAGVTAVFHLGMCWLLVFKAGLGVGGAALANSISCWVNVLMLVVYVKLSPSCAKTWGGFSKEALRDIPTFVKLAIPSAAMVCLENWSFETLVLVSGLLPNPELQTSVFSICMSTATAVWKISFGLSNSLSTRVSNELGAGHPRVARMSVAIVVAMSITESMLVSVALMLIRNIWGFAYTEDVQVVKYVAAVMPVLAFSSLLDGLQCVLSGSVRGCGKQKLGALINLGSYYLVGIPLAVIFAFVLHLGSKGLWMGITCGIIVQAVSLFAITICTNWDQEAKKASKRVEDSMIPVEDCIH